MKKTTIEMFKTMFEEILASENEQRRNSLLLVNENYGGDIVDLCGQEKEKVLALRLQARDTVYIKKIKSALTRIEENRFGECEDCGATISPKRLSARPTAELCIHCKEEEEKAELSKNHKGRYSERFKTNVISMKNFREREAQNSDNPILEIS